MFKKISALFGMLALMVVLTGCTKYSTTIEITDKGEAILSDVTAANIEALKKTDANFDADKALEGNIKNSNYQNSENKLKARGFSVTKYKKGDFFGIEIKKKFAKANYIQLTDLPQGFKLQKDAIPPIYIKQLPFKTTCKINISIAPSKLKEGQENKLKLLNDWQYIKNAAQGENTLEENKPITELIIKIPKKAKKHNATKVDSKTNEYYWELSNMENFINQKPVDIILEYEKINFLSIIITLLTIVFTISFMFKNERYSNRNRKSNMQPF